jgi:polysaccharide deacetylase 2 family uncharacterized protein YibQ
VALPAVVAALGACLLVFVLWAVFAENPLGGEPTATVAFDVKASAQPGKSATGPKAEGAEQGAPNGAPNSGKTATSPSSSGDHVVTIIDGSSGKRQEITVPSPVDAKPVAPVDERLLEATRHGRIPQVSFDGARALDVYSRPVDPTKGDGPRVALIVTGLGVSGATTGDALAKLPSPVTLAFTPYGADVERVAARARGEGHEILLQVPMEPFDYPDNDPGPQTLLTSLAPEQNIDRLQWLMSRIQGYVGVTNYAGGRFTANEQALAPVLREIAKRGLLYVDDGTSPRSLAGQIAGANMMAFAKADIVLDAVPTPTEIDRALTKLEALAKQKGFAVGIAGALPISIDRLSLWAKSTGNRGFVLVPITAIAVKPKAS